MDSNAFLSAIIEGTADAIIGKDLAGKILSWNPAAEKIYGYKKAEMIGRNIDTIVPEDKKPELRDIMSKLKKGEKIESLLTKRQTKEGNIIDVALTISPIKNEQNELIGASTIGRDVTEYLRLQHEVEFEKNKLQKTTQVLINVEAENVKLRQMLK